MTKRSHGDGGIDPRGENAWRLRYRLNGARHTVTFHGTLSDARKELRRLIRTGDTGEHVVPNRVTLSQWAEQWLALLARGEANGKRRGLVGARTRQRYNELLKLYVLPAIGDRPLQQITATEIDNLYIKLETRLSIASVRHVHVCLRACLAVAVRKGYLQKNVADDADVPRPEETETGQAARFNRVEAADRWFPWFGIACTHLHGRFYWRPARRASRVALVRPGPGDEDATDRARNRTDNRIRPAPQGTKVTARDTYDRN